MVRALVAGVVLSLASTVFAAQAVSVKPLRVEEIRNRELVKPATQEPGMMMSVGMPEGLHVAIHVAGDAVKDAASYGKFKITAAQDDTGKDLRPKVEKPTLRFGSSRDEDMEKINKFQMPEGFGTPDAQGKAETGFDANVQLVISSRKATKISTLKGTFQVVAGGEKKTVSVTKLTTLIGKDIKDPVLTAAGIQVKVIDPKKVTDMQVEGPSLVLAIRGKTEAITEVKILDENNTSLSNGYSSSDKQTAYSLNRPLDDKMKVVFELIVGQKRVTVPFDFKDLELP